MAEQQTVEKTGLVEKQVAPNTYRFVLSDESVDRDGDIIDSKGWDLTDFKKNPVALISHDHQKLPIGRWSNLKISAKRLIGDLELASDDVGSLQRAVNRLVKDGFLKAVSVGFRATKREPLDEDNPYQGFRYLKQSLMEAILVSVPSNTNALAIAKSCGLSEGECKKLFVPELNGDDESTTVGESAEKNPNITRAKAAILAANRAIRSK